MKSAAPSTRLEQRIDAAANRLLRGAPAAGWRAGLVEFLVFGAKQAWACVFGFLMLALILAAKFAAPHGLGPIAHNDLVTIGAVLIQLGMVVFGLETLRELRVIILFHVVGTVMELFKTGIGAWLYPGPGILHIGAVPLYSGFMYAAVGSYLVRVYRLFELRFSRYPWRWLTVVIAAAIYANFFTHHWIVDLRWVLLVVVLAVFGPCVMHFRVFRRGFRMPLVVAFGLVAVFIWLGENLATFGGAWAYPDQLAGWHPVTAAKIVSWFLLMIISVVLVAWVYPPRPPVVEKSASERRLADFVTTGEGPAAPVVEK